MSDDPYLPPHSTSSPPIPTSPDADDADDDDNNHNTPHPSLPPARTWCHRTAPDRALAASLDRSRAADLAVHLYNAHAWKARLRDPARLRRLVPHASRQRWLRGGGDDDDGGGNDGDDGRTPWCPRASWTAWPLRPADVPRAGEPLAADAVLLAGDGYVDGGVDGHVLAGGIDGDGPADAPAAASPHRTTTPHWTPSAALEDELCALMLRAVTVRERERARARVHAADEHPDDALPDLLLDDDLATTTLRPNARHVLSGLDTLLRALHTSRAGTRVPDAPCASPSPPSDASPPPAAPPRRHRPLAPRDWSQILGLAALTGWSGGAVQRASRRCAALFDEEMPFCPVPRVPVAVAGIPAPARVADTGVAGASTGAGAAGGAAAPRLYTCPHPTCPLHPRPFAKPFRWREHLRRVHALDHAAVAALEEQLPRGGGAADAAGGFGAAAAACATGAPAPPAPLLCPAPSCPRHHYSRPFPSAWRWREHLTRCHGYSREEVGALEVGPGGGGNGGGGEGGGRGGG